MKLGDDVMRKMVIRFGYYAEFCGDADKIMEIANLVDDLTPVSSVYSSDDGGTIYYNNNKTDIEVSVLRKNQEIKSFEWYEAFIKNIREESND